MHGQPGGPSYTCADNGAGQPTRSMLSAPHTLISPRLCEAAPLHAHQAPHRPAQHAPLAAAAVESREVLELCGTSEEGLNPRSGVPWTGGK
eukprot:scaffold76067_cov63-Phaeocystis_antarctica.AAC.3